MLQHRGRIPHPVIRLDGARVKLSNPSHSSAACGGIFEPYVRRPAGIGDFSEDDGKLRVSLS
jgi:hypothetical protein